MEQLNEELKQSVIKFSEYIRDIPSSEGCYSLELLTIYVKEMYRDEFKLIEPHLYDIWKLTISDIDSKTNKSLIKNEFYQRAINYCKFNGGYRLPVVRNFFETLDRNYEVPLSASTVYFRIRQDIYSGKLSKD